MITNLRNNMKRIFYVIILMALASCNQFKTNKLNLTMAEINAACCNEYDTYKDSVEDEFQKLLKALPLYRKEFLKEKDAWEEYKEAVLEVSKCEDCGSSSTIYSIDVLAQGIQIRDVPQRYLYLHTRGKDIPPYSKTKFTPRMVADAFSAYIMAVDKEEYIEQKAKYQECLRKEQKCWNELLECREKTSQILTGDIKKVYDIGTNQVLRTKLHQLKNQNQGLGVTGDEVLKCVLPEDCSDKALLDYPGFGIIWAKHCENLNWYPKFD